MVDFVDNPDTYVKDGDHEKLVELGFFKNDRLTIDYTAAVEGRELPEKTVENWMLVLGSKITLPGFEDGLLGQGRENVKAFLVENTELKDAISTKVREALLESAGGDGKK